MKQFEKLIQLVEADGKNNPAVKAANSLLDDRWAKGERFIQAHYRRMENHPDRIVVVGKASGIVVEIFSDLSYQCNSSAVKHTPQVHKILNG